MAATRIRIRCTCCRVIDTSYSAPDEAGFYVCPTCGGPNARPLTAAEERRCYQSGR